MKIYVCKFVICIHITEGVQREKVNGGMRAETDGSSVTNEEMCGAIWPCAMLWRHGKSAGRHFIAGYL